MKRLLFLLIVLCTLAALPTTGRAQDNARRSAQSGGRNASQGHGDNDDENSANDEDPCVDIDDHRFCWTQDPITGIRYTQVPDTAYEGLANRQTMPGMSLGLLHTGNLYSPHLITDFFDRRESHDYLFLNAYSLFAYRPEDVRFFNTRLPYTTVGYTTSGSSNESNDRLRLDFAGNLNKKMGLGTFLDYVYARGEYTSQATKPLKWTSYLYYDDDQYKASLIFNISKLANQENGGIKDSTYVLNPDIIKESNTTEPRYMPTNLDKTWNDMDALNLHFNHSYDLGEWDEVTDPSDSTAVIDRFTSVASIFHSIDFESYDHQFRMDAGADQTKTDTSAFFKHGPYINDELTCDSTSYYSISTYAGIRLNEGFSKWSQFGLAAFIGYQYQNYTLMQDTLDLGFISRKHTSNNLFVGGQLSRHQSRRLQFDATAIFGLSGDKIGNVDVTGHLQTVLPIAKDSITIQASGYFRNQNVSYLMNHYFGNFVKWSEDFSYEKRLHLEGLLRYSLTGTEVKVGVENISNYHYFDALDLCPHETQKEIQVFSLELAQRMHWKAIHWDNRLYFQTSTQEELLSLPKFAIESDLSLRFVIAHALTTQLGCTAHYYTKYKAPVYSPATQQFCVQNYTDCGGYPLFNAYINCNLKRIKFYFMYSGLGTQAFSNDAFLMPLYPLQSSRMEYGVIFDLQN